MPGSESLMRELRGKEKRGRAPPFESRGSSALAPLVLAGAALLLLLVLLALLLLVPRGLSAALLLVLLPLLTALAAAGLVRATTLCLAAALLVLLVLRLAVLVLPLCHETLLGYGRRRVRAASPNTNVRTGWRRARRTGRRQK